MSKVHSKLLARVLVAAGMASVTGIAMAGTSSSQVLVSATLVSGCEVSPNAAIAFGNVSTLLSAGDQIADSGTTFQVACSTDAVPTIASATARKMTKGANNLPFNLSLTSGAASDDLPTTPTALTLTKDGTLQTVTLYAKVLKSNFTGGNALPGGAYTGTMTVDIAY